MVTECQGDPSCDTRETGGGDQSSMVSVRITDASSSSSNIVNDNGSDNNSSLITCSNTNSPARKVIAVDVDEVLGQFVLRLCAFHNDRHGTELTPEHFNSYNFHEVWGGSRAEADKKMRDFFESRHFLDGLPVVEGAADVLRKHCRDFDLQIVTSRQDILEEHTRKWIDAHYSGIFGELHFGNHFSTHGVVRSKPDICSMIGAVMIIDDNMRYATECAAAGVRTCLFGDYAWNRTNDPLPENVRRTVCWAEVDAELQSILDSGKNSSSSSSSSSINNGGTNGPAAVAAAADLEADGGGAINGLGVGADVAGESTPAVVAKKEVFLRSQRAEEEADGARGAGIGSQNPPTAAQEVDPPPVTPAAGPSSSGCCANGIANGDGNE